MKWKVTMLLALLLTMPMVLANTEEKAITSEAVIEDVLIEPVEESFIDKVRRLFIDVRPLPDLISRERATHIVEERFDMDVENIKLKRENGYVLYVLTGTADHEDDELLFKSTYKVYMNAQTGEILAGRIQQYFLAEFLLYAKHTALLEALSDTVNGKLLEQTLPYEGGLDPNEPVCAQVIAGAINPENGRCESFPTPCDVPEGWHRVRSCDAY